MEPKEVAAEARQKAAIQPLIEAVDKIADAVVTNKSEFNAKLEEIQSEAANRMKEHDAKYNKSFEDVIQRIELMKKSSNAFNKASLGVITEERESALRNSLPDHVKKNMGLHEAVQRSLDRQSKGKTLLKSPEICAMSQEWFVASTQYQCGPRKGDPSLLQRRDHARTALNEAHGVQKATLLEETANVGQELIPTVTEAEILRLIQDEGQVFPGARQMALTALTTNIPSESTAFSVGWVDENGALSDTGGNFSQVQIIAEKLAARATMSVELVQDSAPGLLPWLLSVFSTRMARELDLQLVTGDGTGPQITGITNATGVTAITSGTAGGRALTYALLVQLFTGSDEGQPRNEGVFIASKRGLTQMLSLVGTDGHPILRIGQVEGAPAMTLFGRPIIVSGALGGSATLDDTTNTNTTICFGPLNALIAGTRMGMTWDVTDQVGWANFRMDARLVGRFGGNVGVPAAWTYLSHINY